MPLHVHLYSNMSGSFEEVREFDLPAAVVEYPEVILDGDRAFRQSIPERNSYTEATVVVVKTPCPSCGHVFTGPHACRGFRGGPAYGGPPPVGAREPPQTEFTVTLTGYEPANKIRIIRAIRDLTKVGLIDARDMSESLPQRLAMGVTRAEAEMYRRNFEEVGGQVSIT